ncbi:c-type cytochrome [Erythrobacter sp. HA6-11]
MAYKPEQSVALDRTAKDHHAFVQAACGGCHAVDPPGLSPNPQAPTFESIANRPGLTEDTLEAWLTDAHNYPEVMDFDLEPRHVEWVAEHMISLRRKDYTPPPS